MSEDPIHQPHDKLFKAGFSNPANAAAFLRWEVPSALSEQINWNNLRLEPGSFVDSHFRHTESDLLFSTSIADSECLLYLLFEHQITAEPTLALRLLRYMVRIWESWLKKHPTPVKLPVILPIVLAQNAEAWNLSPHFASLLNVPAGLHDELRGFIPDFTFRLIQLAGIPFDAIRGTPAGIMTLRVMKAERLAKLLDDPVWDEALMIQVPRETLEWLIRYIVEAGVDKDAFDRKLLAITQPDIRSTAMTIAQQLRQEGIITAQQKAVLEALEIRFDQVPQGLRETIEAIQDELCLRNLLRAAIQAASIEVFSHAL
ncbi:MAG: Rpn family recombination-promoting nuclease/putative transposase [Verrucomicrobia bacterium]|nr:Rpn family recombination-promoting nuclease/putative transposase [Verrucomicrobiota bacterium]